MQTDVDAIELVDVRVVTAVECEGRPAAAEKASRADAAETATHGQPTTEGATVTLAKFRDAQGRPVAVVDVARAMNASVASERGRPDEGAEVAKALANVASSGRYVLVVLCTPLEGKEALDGGGGVAALTSMARRFTRTHRKHAELVVLLHPGRAVQGINAMLQPVVSGKGLAKLAIAESVAGIARASGGALNPAHLPLPERVWAHESRQMAKAQSYATVDLVEYASPELLVPKAATLTLEPAAQHGPYLSAVDVDAVTAPQEGTHARFVKRAVIRPRGFAIADASGAGGVFQMVSIPRATLRAASAARQALAELRLLRALVEHRANFVVRLLAVRRSAKAIYAISELHRGGTLADLVGSRKASRKGTRSLLSEGEAGFYAACACLALCEVHAHRVCIGPLTPDKLVLHEHGILRLVDVSCVTEQGSPNLAIEGDDAIAFASPEVLEGENAHPASDIWSIGCLVYFMLYGASPFADDGTQSSARKIAHFIKHQVSKSYRSDASVTSRSPLLRPPNGFDNALAASVHAGSLVASCLHPLAEKRPTASNILTYGWLSNFSIDAIKRGDVPPPNAPAMQEMADVTANLGPAFERVLKKNAEVDARRAGGVILESESELDFDLDREVIKALR